MPSKTITDGVRAQCSSDLPKQIAYIDYMERGWLLVLVRQARAGQNLRVMTTSNVAQTRN